MSHDTQLEVKIRVATFPADKAIVAALFLAYAKSLHIDLGFQNFEQELASLPGKYAVQNGGAVYLAYTATSSINPSMPDKAYGASSPALQLPISSSRSEDVIGCVALRSLLVVSATASELKRLYITPSSRGLGVSKLLMDAALRHARQFGYREMLLDTLKSMEAARKLYVRCGFVEVEPYYENREDCVFYRKVL